MSGEQLLAMLDEAIAAVQKIHRIWDEAVAACERDAMIGCEE